jgi:hypothetical protein
MPTFSLCRSSNPNCGAVVLEKRGYENFDLELADEPTLGRNGMVPGFTTIH